MRADEKLTAFVELESAIRLGGKFVLRVRAFVQTRRRLELGLGHEAFRAESRFLLSHAAGLYETVYEMISPPEVFGA